MTEPKESSKLKLKTGALTLEQINLMMRHLPLEVTFVDENDAVVYYSAAPDGMFPRSEDVLGGTVVACHSDYNHDKICELMDDFKLGNKDLAEQWVERDGKTYHIWYLPMHDERGSYRGTIEAALDVTMFLSRDVEQ